MKENQVEEEQQDDFVSSDAAVAPAPLYD